MLIDFCYTGSIDINETNVFKLFDTASRTEFTLIEDACSQFLQDNLNVSNCLNTWTLSDCFPNLKVLTALAMKFVQENFVDVAETNEFLLLDAGHLTALLIGDGLIVFSEEEVFNAMSKWINYDFDNRKHHASDLLVTIRYAELNSKVIEFFIATDCQSYLNGYVYFFVLVFIRCSNEILRSSE